MKKSNLLKSFAALACAAAFVSCSKAGDDGGNGNGEGGGQNPPADETIPSASEIRGVWGALADKFELNYGKSALYQMTEDGNDFALDENGDYITVTIEEYVNEWCESYNSDPANEGFEAHPEDVVVTEYIEQDGIINFGTFEVTESHIVFNQGIAGASTISVTSIDGDYEYDETSGVMHVRNLAIADDPVDLDVRVRKNENGGLTFTYTDFYMYTVVTYDGSTEYWPYTPVSYICQEGEVAVPDAMEANSLPAALPGLHSAFAPELRKAF